MIITIIGSMSKKDSMLEVKRYFERFGHQVNCPWNEERNEKPLLEKQSEWIEKIEKADLVVAIPKETRLSHNDTKFVLDFEDSTSYELAIALRFEKQVVFW